MDEREIAEYRPTKAQKHNFSKMILCGYRKQLAQIMARDTLLGHDIIHDLCTIRVLLDDALRKWDSTLPMEVCDENDNN
jgi:hypothetical protein